VRTRTRVAAVLGRASGVPTGNPHDSGVLTVELRTAIASVLRALIEVAEATPLQWKRAMADCMRDALAGCWMRIDGHHDGAPAAESIRSAVLVRDTARQAATKAEGLVQRRLPRASRAESLDWGRVRTRLATLEEKTRQLAEALDCCETASFLRP
jgi:hypothetical protein